MINNKNNRIMETTKFTKAELNAITNRLNAIHAHGSEELSLKDRLVSYYMTTDENLTKEEAEQTVSRLMSGVDDLTSKYKAALENGWNPNEHIAEMTAGMTTQERYDFLVNAISIVKNLNVNILGDASDIKGDVEAAIAEMKASNAEVTDATCAALQASLAELLESSPLMLTGEDKIKEMMDAARGQSTNVVDFASSEYDDYRYKNEMALAAWIEHKQNISTKRVVFVVGGPYGFSQAVYNAAHEKLSLSKMTFSHQMIRLLFIEQLYRAYTIINHLPYHHE